LYSMAFSVTAENHFKLYRIHWVKDLSFLPPQKSMKKNDTISDKKEDNSKNKQVQTTRNVENKNDVNRDSKKPENEQKVQKNRENNNDEK